MIMLTAAHNPHESSFLMLNFNFIITHHVEKDVCFLCIVPYLWELVTTRMMS